MTIQDDELLTDASESNKPGPITILILLLLVLAMVATLVWPLLHTGGYRCQPTPTPLLFLQEA